MYILNISFMVEFDVHQRWLDVMRDNFLPLIARSGFGDTVFTRVISNDTPDGFTYSVQVPLEDMGWYNRFFDTAMCEYASVSSALFGDKVLYFASLLKKIEWNDRLCEK